MEDERRKSRDGGLSTIMDVEGYGGKAQTFRDRLRGKKITPAGGLKSILKPKKGEKA